VKIVFSTALTLTSNKLSANWVSLWFIQLHSSLTEYDQAHIHVVWISFFSLVEICAAVICRETTLRYFCFALISGQSQEKLPASKVEGIVDPRIGVATCITKTESAPLAGSQDVDETPVKQPLASTSASTPGINADVSQTSSVQEAGKQTDLSSAGVHGEGLISLHEDDRRPLGTRDAQWHDTRSQPAEVRHHAGPDSAATWSNNCVNLRSSPTEGATGSSQFIVNLLFVYFS